MTSSALREQSGSRRLQYIERKSAAIARPEQPQPHTLTRTHPSLANIVEQITDWDVPDDEVAWATTPKLLPSTTPCLVVQYRVPARSDRHFGSTGYQLRKFRHVVSTIGSGVVTARPSGPLGLIIVRLKPEAAAGLVGCRMQEFIDEKIDLGDAFKAGDVSLLDALESGHVAYAALDVRSPEPPLPGSDRITHLPNVLLTQHIAASSVESIAGLHVEAANQILAMLRQAGRLPSA